MAGVRFFNHDIRRWVPDTFSGRSLYSSRVLGITEPEDIVQLPPELEFLWEGISEHYAKVGLSHSLNPLWDLSLETLVNNGNRELSLFLFDDITKSSSSAAHWFRSLDPEWFKCVRFINSKNNFVQLARTLGIPTPATTCAENLSQLDLSSVSFPCYIKPALSGNGRGIVRCSSLKKLEKALGRLDHNLPLQIQEEVRTDHFINLQYTASGGKFSRLAATNQILDQYVYIGSSYPIDNEPWEFTDPLAEWLVTRGMKGLFAFDLAVIETGNGPSHLALECNPRFNGASYPTIIAGKLGIESWSFESFSTGFRNLDEIRMAEIEFDPASGEGIVLVTWGTVLAGKLGILLAGSEEKQARLRIKLGKIL